MKKAIVIGLISILALAGCAKAPVKIAEKPVIPPKYYLAGRVQASEAADLSAAFIGRVETVLVSVGQSVKAGDPLVQFDSTEASAQTEVTRQALAIAQANLEKAKTGARPEQIRQAEAAMASAKITWENTQNNLKRQQSLYDTGAIALVMLETAQAQEASAGAAFRNYTEALAILKSGETKAYLVVLEKQVQQAQASVTSSEASLANRTVVAPFDGIVVACPAKAGETYLYQTPLISLENRDRLTIDAYGPVGAASHFTMGDEIKARVAEQPGKEITGTVTWVGNTVDPKRRDVLVKISLDPEASTMAGMFAEIAPVQ